ncbi:hypothetical protein O1R50_24740 [Glycomyces luteolus]|uniref:Uncharacterized protein n=1 Tax=Glycomyces luteolus TaxID=2670330 RepID=A0A9X3SVS8_9ACTN|nr:hypothetical protein [Glycomyces luteolus]MDA1362848.1 hypothetical protein [Glycomyces luteolus]
MTAFQVRRVRGMTLVESRRPRPHLAPEVAQQLPPHRPHPECTALTEARGALLYWDVLDRSPHPDAEIHDEALAADWLWEIYGPDAADAILHASDSIATEWESPVLDAARRLAHLRWAEAWWPSSHAAAIPALDTGLLRAEAAWRTAAVEHLLDDEEAVERALAEADATAAEALDPALGASELTAALEDLAEDYGVALRREPVHLRQEDWALAAGGDRAVDFALASGGAPVDWTQVPQGLVDAAAGAAWTLTQREGGLTITVTVPAAPEARDLHLTARIGGVELPLILDPETRSYSGETEAPQALLLLPADRRVLHVFAPDFSVGDERNDPRRSPHRAEIIEFARERLTDPAASLAERAA